MADDALLVSKVAEFRFVAKGPGAAWSCWWRHWIQSRTELFLPCPLALATSVSTYFPFVVGDIEFNLLQSCIVC